MSENNAVPRPKTALLELPSRGLLYQGQLPNGELEARPIATRDEKVLGDTRRFLDIVNTYLERSAVGLEALKGFTHLDLLSSDRLYCMFMIRAMSYGPLYEFEFRCEVCQKKSFGSVNITELPVLYLPADAAEPFHVTLPDSGDEIEFRLFRGHDEMEVDKFNQQKGKLKKRRTAREDDSAKIFQLARAIVSVNGDPLDEDPTKNNWLLRDYVASLLPMDSNELSAAIEATDSGLDLEIELECKSCNILNDIDLPILPEFFRSPRRKSRLRSAGAV